MLLYIHPDPGPGKCIAEGCAFLAAFGLRASVMAVRFTRPGGPVPVPGDRRVRRCFVHRVFDDHAVGFRRCDRCCDIQAAGNRAVRCQHRCHSHDAVAAA